MLNIQKVNRGKNDKIMDDKNSLNLANNNQCQEEEKHAGSQQNGDDSDDS